MMDAATRNRLLRERRWKLMAFLSILAMALLTLVLVEGLLLAFVLSFVIAYILSPISELLERRGFDRSVAVAIPFFSGTMIIGGALALAAPMIAGQGSVLLERLPEYQKDITGIIGQSEKIILRYWTATPLVFSRMLTDWLADKSAQIPGQLPHLFSVISTVIIMSPFFAFFMLRDGRRMVRGVVQFVPNHYFETVLSLIQQINRQLGQFIRARFFEAAIVGFVVWIGLEALRFPYASLLALFAGITNLIPYIGPVIGAVPGVFIALVSPEAAAIFSPGVTTFLVGMTFLAAQMLDVFVIIPLVVARTVDLHPVSVLITIIIGAKLNGVLGMMIAIPVASALKLTFGAVYESFGRPGV